MKNIILISILTITCIYAKTEGYITKTLVNNDIKSTSGNYTTNKLITKFETEEATYFLNGEIKRQKLYKLSCYKYKDIYFNCKVLNRK